MNFMPNRLLSAPTDLLHPGVHPKTEIPLTTSFQSEVLPVTLRIPTSSCILYYFGVGGSRLCGANVSPFPFLDVVFPLPMSFFLLFRACSAFADFLEPAPGVEQKELHQCLNAHALYSPKLSS